MFVYFYRIQLFFIIIVDLSSRLVNFGVNLYEYVVTN